jgi:hypothetical protein
VEFDNGKKKWEKTNFFISVSYEILEKGLIAAQSLILV